MSHLYLADRGEWKEAGQSVPLTGLDFYGIRYNSKCGRPYGEGGYEFCLYMLPADAAWPDYPADIRALDAAVKARFGWLRTNLENADKPY